ncbi:MAG: dephospho-CoA kinase, partial [candidate division NC10 bacterium]|nr:dephospho-CoA kinase [candidate division NC10 bacterium]
VVVGLTGGIATGKSTVAAMFAARGAAVVDADRIAHALQEPGQPCHHQILEAFGTEILDGTGRIDRRRLGARVFAEPAARRRLEAIMHPAIRAACENEIRAAEASGRPVCLVDAALILESGQRDRFDAIVLVSAPEAVQVDRLVRSRRLTEAEARQRIQSQWTTTAKAALADFVIDTGGDLADTEGQVARVYAALGGGTPGG